MPVSTLTVSRLDDEDRARAARIASMLRADPNELPKHEITFELARLLERFLRLSAATGEVYIADLFQEAGLREALVLQPESELSLEQAAAILGLSPASVEHRVRIGRLPFRSVDGQFRFTVADVLDLKDQEDRMRGLMQEMYNEHSRFDDDEGASTGRPT